MGTYGSGRGDLWMRKYKPDPGYWMLKTSANYCALLGIPWSLNMGKAVMHARRI